MPIRAVRGGALVWGLNYHLPFHTTYKEGLTRAGHLQGVRGNVGLHPVGQSDKEI